MSKRTEHIESNEAFTIIVAVRYAITRASYAVGLVADYVAANWDRLGDSDKGVIIRDVKDELKPERAHLFCGHDMDRRTWQKFLERVCVMDAMGVSSELVDVTETPCKRCSGTGQVGDHHGSVKPCPMCQRTNPVPSIADRIVDQFDLGSEDSAWDRSTAINAVERILETERRR